MAEHDRIAILMGSDSDWPIMEKAYQMCRRFGVGADVRVLSAHRRPDDTAAYARGARERGIEVVIAGAGAAAHLPGVVASHTTLPVIGVPVAAGDLGGLDALLAIVQMPTGVPVATVGVGRAANAALLALGILAVADAELAARLEAYRRDLVARGAEADERLRSSLEREAPPTGSS